MMFNVKFFFTRNSTSIDSTAWWRCPDLGLRPTRRNLHRISRGLATQWSLDQWEMVFLTFFWCLGRQVATANGKFLSGSRPRCMDHHREMPAQICTYLRSDGSRFLRVFINKLSLKSHGNWQSWAKSAMRSQRRHLIQQVPCRCRDSASKVRWWMLWAKRKINALRDPNFVWETLIWGIWERKFGSEIWETKLEGFEIWETVCNCLKKLTHVDTERNTERTVGLKWKPMLP